MTIRGVTYPPTHDKPAFDLRSCPVTYERRLETAKRMVGEDVVLPLGRALLRKYVRASQGFEAAQSALLGRQDLWDVRGERGGLWTDGANWVRVSEVCEGQERDLFDNDLGHWSKENGDPGCACL